MINLRITMLRVQLDNKFELVLEMSQEQSKQLKN